MDNLAKDVAAAQRLGYGCHYGRYKVDHPHTSNRSVEVIPEPEDNEPPHRCKHCGKIFKPRDGHQVFCTEECRQDRRRLLNRLNKQDYTRKPMGEAVCPVCNVTFPRLARKQIYCGRACAAVVRNKTRKKKV